jgi:transcriptional regulator of acetoin/glycerol metabolism
MDILISYNWPGNVRELRNVVERAASCCAGGTIEPKDLPADIVNMVVAESELPCQNSLPEIRNQNERQLIMDVLSREDWNMVRTSKTLGISRATLYEKLKKYNISRPRNDDRESHGPTSDFTR